jgi:hypothetical protein
VGSSGGNIGGHKKGFRWYKLQNKRWYVSFHT